MAGEHPEKYALRIHTVEVVKAIELNLGVIAQRLVQQEFITSHQASNITGTLGISAFDKASKLMSSVEAKMVYDSRQKWFEKFMYILANNTTHGDLVKILVEDFVKRKPHYKGDLLRYKGDTAEAPTCMDVQNSECGTEAMAPTKRSKDASPPNSTELLKLLYKTAANLWYEIGTFLEIPRSELDILDSKYKGNPQKCLMDMCGKWLDRCNRPPSWHAMAEALQFLGKEHLAQTIRDTYL